MEQEDRDYKYGIGRWSNVFSARRLTAGKCLEALFGVAWRSSYKPRVWNLSGWSLRKLCGCEGRIRLESNPSGPVIAFLLDALASERPIRWPRGSPRQDDC